MKILICSDGTAPAESAIRLGGLLAGSLRAQTTLLGITENPADERSLRDALEGQAQSLRAENVFPEVVVHAAEPPAIYADLVSMEEDVDRLLESRSELGRNLLQQKKELERIGVSAEVRVRHGIVIDQVFEEVREGDYDLIVTGTSQARGLLRHYIMGDLTRSILNRANSPVLVARGGPPKPGRTLWKAIKGLFAGR